MNERRSRRWGLILAALIGAAVVVVVVIVLLGRGSGGGDAKPTPSLPMPSASASPTSTEGGGDVVDPDVAKLIVKFQAALATDSDPSPVKAEKVLLLGAVYRHSGDAVKFATTWKELFDRMVSLRKTALSDDSIPMVRRAVADYLETVLPTDPKATFNDASRKLAGAEYAKVGAALSKVK